MERWSSLFSKSKIRMLFLTSLEDYNVVMDRWVFMRYEAALKHPYVDASLWGPDFPRWNASLTIRQNLLKTYGTVYFDIVVAWIWHSPVPYKKEKWMTPQSLRELKEISNETAILIMEDETWCDVSENCSTEKIDVLSGATLMARAYAHELLLPHNQLLAAQGVYFHLPKTAAADHFFQPADAHKDIDILLIGAQSFNIYPIRTRTTAVLLDSAEFQEHGVNVYHYAHPGYWESEAKDTVNVSIAMQQFQKYASLLKRAKIVVTDSSRYLYGVMKYAEVPIAGALLVGDLPAEREDDIAKYIVPINLQMSRQDIVVLLLHWLQNNDKRIQRAELGQKIALSKFTHDHAIDLILSAYVRLKQGRYGTWFPFPFSLRCRGFDPSSWTTECGNTTATPDMFKLPQEAEALEEEM